MKKERKKGKSFVIFETFMSCMEQNFIHKRINERI